MLKDNLYQLKSIEKLQENSFNVQIHLDKEHDIFKGHFPGNPVLPGVCMVQIMKEISSKITQENLQLKTSKSIKFLELINPNENPNLDLKLEITEKTNSNIIIKNTCYFQDVIALRMQVNYKIL